MSWQLQILLGCSTLGCMHLVKLVFFDFFFLDIYPGVKLMGNTVVPFLVV